jgi:hypothetical protein
MKKFWRMSWSKAPVYTGVGTARPTAAWPTVGPAHQLHGRLPPSAREVAVAAEAAGVQVLVPVQEASRCQFAAAVARQDISLLTAR